MPMRGLVLEGGGAKGAFQCGALKALYENGYSFDGVAGTSIGAINGALIVQEDGIESCYRMWTNFLPDDIIDIDNLAAMKMFSREYDRDTVMYLIKKAAAVVQNRGVPTDKIIPYLKQHIDEDKIRESNRQFAVITISISDRKALELNLEDIPYGELHKFIFASAYYPAFRIARMDGKFYLDGGLYDNLPVNALLRKGGYNEIIAIRTMSKMPHKAPLDKSVSVHYICPSEDLGSTTNISNRSIMQNIKLGYYDALKFIKGYAGEKYYFQNDVQDGLTEFLEKVSVAAIQKIAAVLKIDGFSLKREDIVEHLRLYLNLAFSESDLVKNDVFLIFLERYAKLYGVEKFRFYTFDSFFEALIGKYRAHNALNTDKPAKLISKIKYNKTDKIFSLIMDDILGE